MSHVHDEDYFGLIERVGSKGRYQRNLILLFYAIWFVTAFVILGVSFLLMSNDFVCPHTKDALQCKQWVCAKPSNQWLSYQPNLRIGSILLEFQKQCESQSEVANYRMTLFLGVLFGYIIFTYLADNFGRRMALITTWTTANIGILILCISQSMSHACVGLFLAGAGCESNIRVNLAIINQVVDYHKRQIYSLTLQSAFGLAGTFVALGYYWLYNWRIVIIIFCLLPAIATLYFMIKIVQETPSHLSSKGAQVILQSLERIANTNKLECKVTVEDVQRVIALNIQHQNKQRKYGTYNLFHLFIFKSLRSKTIYLSIILFFLASLYIGPISIVDSFQVDVFVLQIILSISDCISNPIACFFISSIERRKAGIKYFTITCIFIFLGILTSPQQGCLTCFNSMTRLSMLCASRYCICYYYGIVFLYIVQLYPEKIRGIGFGTVSAFGALGSALAQKVFGFAKSNGHDPLIYMLFFSIICLYACSKLPQTHDSPLQIQIEQLKRKKLSQRYEPQLQESICELPNSANSLSQYSARTENDSVCEREQTEIDQN